MTWSSSAKEQLEPAVSETKAGAMIHATCFGSVMSHKRSNPMCKT